MNYLNKIRRNAHFFHHVSSGFVLTFVGSIVFFFLTPSLLLNLGKERYGIWVILFSLISYFNTSNLGITQSFFYEYTRIWKIESTNKLINTVYFGLFGLLLLPFSATLLLLFNFESWFVIPAVHVSEAKISLIILFLAFTVNFTSSVFDSILFAHQKITSKNILDLAKIVLTGGVQYVLCLKGFGLVQLFLAELFFSLLRGVVVYYLAGRQGAFTIHFSYFDRSVLKKHISPSLYYFLGSISGLLAFQTDTLVIAHFMGAAYVASYSIMYKFVTIPNNILGNIVNTKIPKASQLFFVDKNYKGVWSIYKQITLLVLALLLSGCLIVFFFGIPILNVWVKRKVEFDPLLLSFFIALLFVNVMSNVSGRFNSAFGWHKQPTIVGIVEAFLNLGCSIIFLKIWGIVGIAAGTLLTHCICGGWFAHYHFFSNLRKAQRQEIGKI